MQTAKGRIVIIDPNTPDMKVMFDGVEVQGVQDLKIDWDKAAPKMTLTLFETEQVAALKSIGINVRRQA